MEIGLGEGFNFKSIRCEGKYGVDPNFSPSRPDNNSVIIARTSDVFFEQVNEKNYDIIFIDGLHHSDQVEKDIVNAYKVLNKGGIILLHDCVPWDEKIISVPRETHVWTGDVFRAVCGFYEKYSQKIKMRFFPERTGIVGIWKTGKYKVELGFNKPNLTYQEFDKNWKQIIVNL